MSRKPKHPNDNQPGETRAVRKLRARLDESRQLHALTGDPQLNAVRADRFRVSITRSLWFFLAAGLGFTTTGVHEFLAGHLTPADSMWWGAWLVEPALAGILITLLRWEAQMLSQGIPIASEPVSWFKRVLLGATLITNVWCALAPADGRVNSGMVFLHVVIPLVVFLIAEVMPVIQQRCTTARDQALRSTPTASMPAEPAPAAPASAVPAVSRTRLRLPVHMRDALDARTAQLGRPLTAEDVQAALNVPGDYAARIAEQLAA
jgi:hypothetical protein